MVAMTAALAMAGCGAGGSDAGADDGDAGGLTPELAEMQTDLDQFMGAVTELPDVAAVEGAAALRGKTVWWIPLGPAVDAGVGPAVDEAFSALGVTVRTCDGEFLPTTVATCLDQAVSQGADGVMTGYVDYRSVPAAFDAVLEAGIPVLLAGATNNSGRPQSVEFAVADTTEILQRAARTQLEAAIVDTQGAGNLVWVGFQDSEQLTAVTDYAASYVAEDCPRCTFEQIDINSASLNRLTSQVGATLTSHPDTDYVLVQVDPGVAPVVQAIRTAGLQTSVKVIGIGPTVETMTSLQNADGPLVADSGVSTTYNGWAFSNSLVQMLSGVVPPEQVQSIYRLFTPETVDGLSVTPEAYATADWFTDSDDLAASFTEAWGVS